MQRCNFPIPLSRDGRATTGCTLEFGHEKLPGGELHGAQLPIATEWFDYDPGKGFVANPQRFQKLTPNGDSK